MPKRKGALLDGANYDHKKPGQYDVTKDAPKLDPVGGVYVDQSHGYGTPYDSPTAQQGTELGQQFDETNPHAAFSARVLGGGGNPYLRTAYGNFIGQEEKRIQDQFQIAQRNNLQLTYKQYLDGIEAGAGMPLAERLKRTFASLTPEQQGIAPSGVISSWLPF